MYSICIFLKLYSGAHLIHADCKIIYVTQSGKTGLIAYLKVLRNAGFKYLVCCSSPMVEAMCNTFYTNSLASRASTVQVANN